MGQVGRGCLEMENIPFFPPNKGGFGAALSGRGPAKPGGLYQMTPEFSGLHLRGETSFLEAPGAWKVPTEMLGSISSLSCRKSPPPSF